MQKTVVEISSLGKKYQICHQATPDGRALRHVLGSYLNSLPNRLLAFFGESSSKSKIVEDEEFWALKEISLKIEAGERVGIIGRNGAGKSTLLKILSRITEPNEGWAKIKGRVSSLLEVGTGFHPELTGRENIYLNGSILGMTSSEIREKFDAIVDFSEVEKFLDTPVKRYSSGMFVRLAFSVAAYLDPDILIVDEVLAVGDIQFQQKCLEKLEGVSKDQGRTVILVSHNMGFISRLCQRALFLSSGRLLYDGTPAQAIDLYLGRGSQNSLPNKDLTNAERFFPEKKPALLNLSIKNEHGNLTTSIETGKTFTIEIGYELSQPVPSGYCQVNFFDSMHNRVLTISSDHFSSPLSFSSKGAVKCLVKNIPLIGEFYLDFEMGILFPFREHLDYVICPVKLNFIPGTFFSRNGLLPGQGFIAVESDWRSMN